MLLQVREVFVRARGAQPCVLIFHELDSLVPASEPSHLEVVKDIFAVTCSAQSADAGR